jgi:UDP-glucuronate 4-epimerase
VRPSIEDPVGYQRANVIATQNLLEFAKDQGIKQFVFASSSSVYGVNPNVPWSEKHDVSGSPLTENGKLKTEQPEGTFQAKASSRRIKT